MEELFYVLDTIYASNIRFFAGGQIISESEARCPVCHSLLSSSGTKTIKVALNHLGKQGFAEYLWNSHSLPLFRADLINLWQGAGLSGFRTEPVEIIGWFGSGNQPSLESIPNYYSLITTSYVQLVEPLPEDECKQCGFIRYSFTRIGNHLPNGLRINLRTWDGADFFGLIGYPWIYCSSRVLEVTLKKRFKNIAFIHTSKWNTWEPYNNNIWTPKAYNDYIESFLIRTESDIAM